MDAYALLFASTLSAGTVLALAALGLLSMNAQVSSTWVLKA